MKKLIVSLALLASSALNQMHRFDNPVARVRITRIQ